MSSRRMTLSRVVVTDDGKGPEGFAVYIDGDQDGILDNNVKRYGALIKIADTGFQVFMQLVAVEGLMHHGHIEEPHGNGDGAGIVHGSYDLAIGEGVIALEGNGSDLHLGALVNRENELDGVGGGKRLVGRLYHRELVAVLRLEVLDGHFGFFDFRGVELALDGEAYFAILEAIEDV